jgi:hypothetical protein
VFDATQHFSPQLHAAKFGRAQAFAKKSEQIHQTSKDNKRENSKTNIGPKFNQH